MNTLTVQGRVCVRGVDVSDWQGTVDHQAVKDSGVAFLVAKATEGTRFAAKTYRQNRDGAHAVGLTFGAYHWIKPNMDPVAQAQWFLSTTNNGDGCDFLVLDAEEAGITDDQVTTWCRTVAAAGKPVVIYCGAWTDPKDRSDEWLKYTPWLAAYPTSAENPDPGSFKAQANPKPWGRWDIWQYSSSGRVPGINGLCDVNVADAAWFASLGTAPPSVTPAPPTQKRSDNMRRLVNTDGRVELLDLNEQGQVVSSWQGPDGTLSAWAPVNPNQPGPFTSLDAYPGPDGRLIAVASAAPYGVLFCSSQSAPSAGPWTEWVNYSDLLAYLKKA